MALAPTAKRPAAPRANAPTPAAGRAGAQAPVLKGATAVSTKPTEGQERMKNGVRQVYKNGKWTNVGAVRPTKPSSPGGVPVAPRLVAPEAAPATTTTTTTTTPFKPDAAWWTTQFAADPRYLQTAPGLAYRQQQTAGAYGYRIMRSPSGQPYFKSRSTGEGKITQQLTAQGTPVLDENGAPIYVDESGKRYGIADLDLNIEEIKRGEEGYLTGALGAAAAGSEQRQFGIGDVAAQAGARRSGMRTQASVAESEALQQALRNLAGRAGGEFAGIQSEYADLYNQIFKGLVDAAAAQPQVETTPTAPTPAPAPAPVQPGTAETGLNAGQALSADEFAGQLRGIANAGKNADKKTMIRLYRGLAKRYSLTPAQLRRLTRILRDEYGVGLG